MTFFKAVHKENKSIVVFDLFDIYAAQNFFGGGDIHISNFPSGMPETCNTGRYLEDYDLYYLHQGEYYPYES